MDKILQSKQGWKIMKQIFLLFLTKYVCICFTHFFDQLKITLKLAKSKSWFFQYSKFTQKFMLTYLGTDIRSAETNTTKKFVALLKLFKQLALLSHYVYNFFIFSFEKLFIFLIKDIETLLVTSHFYLLFRLWIIFFIHNFYYWC